ncbi:unnamed protein product [Microthlaspi erraticum]|uniref:Uncharacterized protein n=1 Tax=Microthlaspi erraticum TaxID=1685480 RepID=A0A6D2IN64_9BRAS|nr:unnamed protein product [Microthlaspi erraticum]
MGVSKRSRRRYKCGEDTIWSVRLRLGSLRSLARGFALLGSFIRVGERSPLSRLSIRLGISFSIGIDDGRGKYSFIVVRYPFDSEAALSDHEKYAKREKEKETGETA